MSIYTTETITPPEFTHRKLERKLARGNIISQIKNRSRTYAFDFSRLKKMIGADKDLLYFYPQELDGFIMSCILSTQREREDAGLVGRLMYDDLTSALHEFQRKEEEAAWHSAKMTGIEPTFDGMNIDDYEINQAGRVGGVVMDFVMKQMETVRDVHGAYAISPRECSWTPMDALLVKVHY